jgi:hypothetical protein
MNFIYFFIIHSVLIFVLMKIEKGITLFLNKMRTSNILMDINSLINFLGEEYNFLHLSVVSRVYGLNSQDYTQIRSDEILKTVSENQFRLEGLVVHIKDRPSSFDSIWDQILKFENLIVIVICDDRWRLEAIPKSRVVFRQIIEIKENPEYKIRPSAWNAQSILSNLDRHDRCIFSDVLTEEEFTVSGFKKSYVRDKKIDNLLDNSENM